MAHRCIGHWVAALFLLVLALGASPSARAGYTTVYAFGDSLSDTGNVFAATGGTAPQPGDYFEGRFSNGRVAVEHLADGLGASLVNHAYGGAKTGLANGALAGTPLEMTGIWSQVGFFQDALGGGSADADALYFIWGGANDFQYEGFTGEVAASAISNLVSAIQVLYGLGARHFMVPGLADLGATPGGLASGVSDGLTGLSAFFNANLMAALGALEVVLPGADMVFVDIFAAQHELIDHPGAHGLGNVTGACFSGFVGVAGTQCGTPDEYLYWDRIHPGAVAHRYLGEVMLQAVPEPASLGIALLALAALGLTRRHAVRRGVRAANL